MASTIVSYTIFKFQPAHPFKKAGKDRPHRKAKADSSRFAIGFLLEI